MNCIVLLILSCASALNAHPFGMLGLGLGRRGFRGLGLCETVLGPCLHPCVGRRGLGGLGVGGMAGGYANGLGYGGQQYGSGASGIENQAYQNTGVNSYHNVGAHNNRALSINQAENSGFHNIGGGSAMNNGGYAGNGYNGYQNGGSQFGNGFGSGGQGMMI